VLISGLQNLTAQIVTENECLQLLAVIMKLAVIKVYKGKRENLVGFTSRV